MIVFHHRGSMGDIIYSLPTVIAMGGGAMWISKQGHYNFLKPLLDAQPYIERVISIEAQVASILYLFVELDKYRKVERKNYKDGLFQHLCFCHSVPHNVAIKVDEPWLLFTSDISLKPIVISRSMRYRDNDRIDYRILGDYKNLCIFVGTHSELLDFQKTTGFELPYIVCDNAYQMAGIIRYCKLFIGNQSLGFAMAEALKVPRVLEVYDGNPNCMPNGNHGHVNLSGHLIEKYLYRI